MTRKLLKNESGYSLVEVMAAIVILAIAILPMIGMFDAGLRAASTSGNYDKARALANANLEIAKSMSFSELEASSSCENGGPPAFSCELDTVPLVVQGTGAERRFEEDTSVENPDMLKVTVTISWENGNDFSVSGVVAQ